MRQRYSQITTTESVKRAQRRYGVERPVAGAHTEGEVRLTERETEFIAARDSFYLATVSDTGWPYVQHRGGSAGFLKVLGPATIGFADLRGNRQYLSVGNLGHDDRVALILVDYPNRRRLKLLGHARVVDPADDAALRAQLDLRDGETERLMLIEVVAFDWNCPLHITPRYTAAQIEAHVETRTSALAARVAALETLLRQAGIPLPDAGAALPPLQQETLQ